MHQRGLDTATPPTRLKKWPNLSAAFHSRVTEHRFKHEEIHPIYSDRFCRGPVCDKAVINYNLIVRGAILRTTVLVRLLVMATSCVGGQARDSRMAKKRAACHRKAIVVDA